MKDIVPIVPGRGLGFAHPKGEVHLLAPGTAVACSGRSQLFPKFRVGDVDFSLFPLTLKAKMTRRIPNARLRLFQISSSETSSTM